MRDESLKTLSKWSKFIGCVMIVLAVLSCFTLIGILPGILYGFLGWKLLQASKGAERLYNEPHDAEASLQMVSSLASYFKTLGIIMVISFVLGLVAIVISFTFFATIVSELSRYAVIGLF